MFARRFAQQVWGRRVAAAATVVAATAVAAPHQRGEAASPFTVASRGSWLSAMAPAAALCASRTYSWGYGQFGQLGQGDDKDRTSPAEIQDLERLPASKAASFGCSDCSAVVTETGDLFTFGRGRDGRLGHGKTARGSPENLPRLVMAVKGRVTDVALGEFHGACITKNGELYSWGKGKPALLGHADSNGLPAKVDGLEGQRVVQVACGRMHTVVRTATGKVLTYGQGKFGQLGHGDRKASAVPKAIQLPAGKVAVDIAAGKEHTLVATADGEVYAFGFDYDGQLGQGRSARQQASPQRVSALSGHNIVKVACGENYSAAVTSTGALFTWGFGSEGQLGHGDTASVSIPKQVMALESVAVKDVKCGEAHTLVLTKAGAMLAFGRGRNGQLGRSSQLESQAAYRPLPRPLLFFDNRTVKSFAAGANHSLAVVEEA